MLSFKIKNPFPGFLPCSRKRRTERTGKLLFFKDRSADDFIFSSLPTDETTRSVASSSARAPYQQTVPQLPLGDQHGDVVEHPVQ